MLLLKTTAKESKELLREAKLWKALTAAPVTPRACARPGSRCASISDRIPTTATSRNLYPALWLSAVDVRAAFQTASRDTQAPASGR